MLNSILKKISLAPKIFPLKVLQCPNRSISTKGRKRFFDSVSVVSSDNNGYEVRLDHHRLKTPGGSVLNITSQPLALAIATEWASQGSTILTHQMHITNLMNAVVDNPTSATRNTIIDSLLKFLVTDTILFFSDEPNLLARQKEEWGTLLDWFCHKYGLSSIAPSLTLKTLPDTSDAVKVCRQYFGVMSFPCLYGLLSGANCLKSLILTLAVIEQYITVERSVHLARLEVEFQTSQWGLIEWSHDMEQHDTCARMAAASLFYALNSTDFQTVSSVSIKN